MSKKPQCPKGFNAPCDYAELKVELENFRSDAYVLSLLTKLDESEKRLEAQLAEQKEACESLMIIANQRNAGLEAQLAEKPQALIDIGADDINEHLIERAEKAEKQLEAVRAGYDPMWMEKRQIARADKNAALEENRGLISAIRKLEAQLAAVRLLPEKWKVEQEDSEAMSPDGRISDVKTWHGCADDIKAAIGED